MESDFIPLDIDDRFRFGCSPTVPCFNECCRDLNQFLTPYDIWRLKNRLNMDSGAFLAGYTSENIGPETGLPVVSLRMLPEKNLACPFVTDAGCRVYEDRPTSCRTYPLARAIHRSRESGQTTEHFALIREPHCRGFEQPRNQSVREWIQDQEVETYNRFNDMLMEIIRLKNRMIAGALDLQQQRAFRLGLYDLDAFRAHLQEKGAPEAMGLDASAMNRILEDELRLLRFGHGWVRFALFGALDRNGGDSPPG